MMDPEQPFGNLRPSWYDGELLQLAHDLASRLLPAFEGSSTGIPYPRVSCLLFLNIWTLYFIQWNLHLLFSDASFSWIHCSVYTLLYRPLHVLFSCIQSFPATLMKIMNRGFTVFATDYKSICSIVIIAIGYGLDNQGVGVRVSASSRIFVSLYCPDRLWGSPNLLSNMYPGLIPEGVKQQGREADHPPPTGA
jgi:hypothetical protein